MEPDGVDPLLNRAALLRYFLSKNGVLSFIALLLERDDVLQVKQTVAEGRLMGLAVRQFAEWQRSCRACRAEFLLCLVLN